MLRRPRRCRISLILSVMVAGAKSLELLSDDDTFVQGGEVGTSSTKERGVMKLWGPMGGVW